jgi:hydrophobic/amphiphilic exporter-1 (mainly G- bacteria), HAE1 family
MNPSKSAIGFFAGHPTASNLLMVTFLLLGIFVLKDIRRETFPDFSPSEVEIIVKYPGASAEEIEESISQKIETALEEVSETLEVRSESLENRSRVVAEMLEGGNMIQFLDDIKTEIEAIDDFPRETEKPIIKLLGRTDAVVSIAITGPMSVSDLKFFCEHVKDKLLSLDEISQVDLQGFSDHQIQIQVRAKKLMQFGLSITDITNAISSQNIDLPAGTLETPDKEVLIRFSDERKTVIEYQDLPVISAATGQEVHLGDIAKIVDRFELDEEKIIFNGQRAGILTIKKLKREDSLKIIQAVRNFLDKERQISPPKVQFTLTKNMTDIVKDRIQMLVTNGIEGLILVFLTLWLFFSIRFSFWVVMGLPVSFLAALFAMNGIDFSINMLTMVGLLLALGLVMDDAIVISENVASHLAKGKSPLDAAIAGTKEVTPGVVSSYLTTLVIFGSIPLLLKGEIGKVLWVMPVVLIITLSVSLIEAFFILPNHLAHSLQKTGDQSSNQFRQKFEKILDFVRENLLGKLVDWGVHWRYLLIGLVLFVFLFTLGLVAGGKIKFIGFPEIDGDVLECRILLPQGTPITQTETIVQNALDALDKINKELTKNQPGGQYLIQNTLAQFNKNVDAHESGPHVATISVDLLKAEIRNATLDEISIRWRKELEGLSDVIQITFKEPAIGPGGLPIDIRLQGNNFERLKKASIELQDWLRQYKGVWDITDDLRPGKPEVRIRMKNGALARGLDASIIANQLRAAFYGKTANEIQVGSESYEVDVRLAEEDQNSLADLELFHITDPNGKLYPLGAVANLNADRGLARIARVDSVRTVTIQADVDSQIANAQEIIEETKNLFLPGLMERYPDIAYSIEGQLKDSKTTGKSMGMAFLLGIFGIFVLLSFQFKSYIQPFLIMSAIPLSLIGVIVGHAVMGLDLSMVSIMGFVSLTGVVINDSILLVEFIKIGIREGNSLAESAKQASRQRFRAVLLTSLTTIAGLFPLLLEKSLQAQVLVPMVTSLIFGLMASTFLVLIVVPVLYVIFSDFSETSA